MPDNFKILLDSGVKVVSNVSNYRSIAFSNYLNDLFELKDSLESDILSLRGEVSLASASEIIESIRPRVQRLFGEYAQDLLVIDQPRIGEIAFNSSTRSLIRTTDIEPEQENFDALDVATVVGLLRLTRIINFRDRDGNQRRLNIQREIDKLVNRVTDQFERSIRLSISQANQQQVNISETLPGNLDTTTSSNRNRIDALTNTILFGVVNDFSRLAEEPFRSQIQGYIWVSVMDLRTSRICASLNGTFRRDTDNFPAGLPPVHINCRSTVVPVTNLSDITEISREFTIANERFVNHRNGTRTTLFTTIQNQTGEKDFRRPKNSSNLTIFDLWIRTTPERYQRAWFGEERFALFQSHGLSSKDLVSPQGRVLTIEEIRRNLDI